MIPEPRARSMSQVPLGVTLKPPLPHPAKKIKINTGGRTVRTVVEGLVKLQIAMPTLHSRIQLVVFNNLNNFKVILYLII